MGPSFHAFSWSLQPKCEAAIILELEVCDAWGKGCRWLFCSLPWASALEWLPCFSAGANLRFVEDSSRQSWYHKIWNWSVVLKRPRLLYSCVFLGFCRGTAVQTFYTCTKRHSWYQVSQVLFAPIISPVMAGSCGVVGCPTTWTQPGSAACFCSACAPATASPLFKMELKAFALTQWKEPHDQPCGVPGASCKSDLQGPLYCDAYLLPSVMLLR